MKKIVGILVCMLVIAAAVLPAAGIITFNIKKVEKPVSSDATIEKDFKDSLEINKPDGTPPQPAATKTDYLSIPAAAFIPEEETINYFNWGTYLKGDGWFNAPVYFPNDATVTKVIVYWWDTSGDDLHFILIRYPIGYETEVKMAEGTSSGSGGEGFTMDDTIDSAVIDNTGYSYFLYLDLPTFDNMKFRNALIEYTYETGGNSADISVSQQNQELQDSLSR